MKQWGDLGHLRRLDCSRGLSMPMSFDLFLSLQILVYWNFLTRSLYSFSLALPRFSPCPDILAFSLLCHPAFTVSLPCPTFISLDITHTTLITMSSSESEPQGFRSRHQELRKRLAVRRQVIEQFSNSRQANETQEPQHKVEFKSLTASIALPKREASEDDESIDMFGESDHLGEGKGKVEDQEITDQQGYYVIYKGKQLQGGRYQLEAKIGRGVFGVVARALDRNRDQTVAIKVIRKNAVMEASGEQEYSLVRSMRKSKYILGAEDCFRQEGHLFIVSGLMGDDLRSFTRKHQDRVGLPQVQKYAVDMFLALHELRKHQIVHADIKPDNFLLAPDHAHICLTDFGTAFCADQLSTEVEYLVARYYRPPEVVLGCHTSLPQRHAIDTWAVGCSLYELFTGQFLFEAGSNHQLLALILQTKGRVSLKMLKKCQHRDKYFDEDNNFLSPSYDPRTQATTLHKIQPTVTPERQLLGLLKRNSQFSEDPKQLALFADFLENCLSLNPKNRLVPFEAFRHPFLNYMVTLN